MSLYYKLIKNKKILSCSIIVLLFSSCINTKYTYDFKKGKDINFSTGKWILNKPYTNQEIKHVYDAALSEFRSILGDSLLEITDLRGRDYLIQKKIPYHPTKQHLEDIRIGSNCDFIINYEITLLKNEIGSISSPPLLGTVKQTNEATVEILIYDLNSLELVSQTSILGKAELEINEDEKGWDLVNPSSVIARNALIKIIKRYKKNRIK